MRRLGAVALGLVVVAGTATAQPKKKPPPTPAELAVRAMHDALAPGGERSDVPLFAFTLSDALAEPAAADVPIDFEMGFDTPKKRTSVGLTADGKAAWVAADLEAITMVCGDETCPRVAKPDSFYHGSAVLQLGAQGWVPVAWAADESVTAKDQADLAARRTPDPTHITRKVRLGAIDVVGLFEKTLADPRALAATVSPRAEAVLYGSEFKERYAGGKKVAAQLLKWNLGFKVRDGLDAGITGNGQLAWVAANVDATSLKKKGAKATPYRAFFIYEKGASGWQLVVAHFSFVL